MVKDIGLPFHIHEREVFEVLLKTPGDVFQSQNCRLVANPSGIMGAYSSLLAQRPILADSEGHKMDQLLFGLQHAVPKGYCSSTQCLKVT